MLRWLYIRLLWMHPPRFRSRFCDEMLDDFDLSGRRESWRLMRDAAASVFRQWILRPEFQQEPAAAPADSAVMFHSLEDYRPSAGVFAYGSTISVAAFLLVVFALAHSNVGRQFYIGMRRPGLGLISIDRSAFTEGAGATEVRTEYGPEDPMNKLAAFYFRENRAAQALDVDRDFAIADWEMRAAPAALSKIDLDHDGSLSPEECGFHMDTAGMTPAFLARARLNFMQMHPLLAALDTNADGQISYGEIQTSAVALKRLDRNADGALTPIEILPELAATQAAMIRLRFDTDSDGNISPQEKSGDVSELLRELLDAADSDSDGVITSSELESELARRHEARRQLDNAAHTVARPRR